ncbi:hypothetical protein QPK87_09375 [Kamptonema cortianum]|nr:hypothetical protein [Kamptonema cortianum]
MKKTLASISLLLMLGVSAWSTGLMNKTAPEEIFQAANIDFLGARYDDAIAKYQSLLDAKILSPALFYNLANAYARDGATGLAIVNYQRALYLSPRDPDTQANLAFTANREQIALPETPWYLAYTTFLRPNVWFALSLALMIVASVFGILRTLKIQLPDMLRKKLIPTCALLMAILCLVSGYLALQRFQYAVVTKPDTALTLSPVSDAQLVSVLNDGVFVKPVKSHGDYLLVETFTRQRGWLPKSSVENILPTR